MNLHKRRRPFFSGLIQILAESPLPPLTTDFCLAYSGGIDSQALLHSLMCLRKLGYIKFLRAIHINHGLSPLAFQWQKHCEKTCQQWHIPLKSFELTFDVSKDLSLEAQLRDLRYEKLASEVSKNTCIITAHHQDDQAETLFLQLIRGGGLRGLAAMPLLKQFHQGHLWRPCLSLTRADIETYVQQNHLDYVEDQSNQDLRFDRNFLRHEIFPLLKKRWLQIPLTFSNTAQYCAQALFLEDELAQIDLQSCYESTHHCLNIDKLLKLPDARIDQVIRYFLRKEKRSIPSPKKLNELKKQMFYADSTKQPHVHFGSIHARRYQNQIYFLSDIQQPPKNYEAVWDLESSLTFPLECGMLKAEATSPHKVIVRFRKGGERMNPEGRCGSHPLKKLFQEWNIPPWKRSGIPLIFWKEHLMIVPGYAQDIKVKDLNIPSIHFYS